MRILFDQGTPIGIREYLPMHTVRTAHEMNWSTLSNGDLLRAAEEAGFEAFVTTDKSLIHQQNLKTRQIRIVILSQARWKLIREKIDVVISEIEKARPGMYAYVEISD